MPHPFAADFTRTYSPLGIDGWEHRQTHGLRVRIELLRHVVDEARIRLQSIVAPTESAAPTAPE